MKIVVFYFALLACALALLGVDARGAGTGGTTRGLESLGHRNLDRQRREAIMRKGAVKPIEAPEQLSRQRRQMPQPPPMPEMPPNPMGQ